MPSDRPTAPPIDQQLCFVLYSTTMAMTRAYKEELAPHGLTYPQYLVLQLLWQTDGQTIGALASRLSLEPSTITPMVKRLEKVGLVERVRSRQDERQVHVQLTQTGHDLRQEVACIHEKLLSRTGFTSQQIEALTQTVCEIREALRS